MRRELYTVQNESVKGRIGKDSFVGGPWYRGDAMLQKVTYSWIKSMKIEETAANKDSFSGVDYGSNPPGHPA